MRAIVMYDPDQLPAEYKPTPPPPKSNKRTHPIDSTSTGSRKRVAVAKLEPVVSAIKAESYEPLLSALEAVADGISQVNVAEEDDYIGGNDMDAESQVHGPLPRQTSSATVSKASTSIKKLTAPTPYAKKSLSTSEYDSAVLELLRVPEVGSDGLPLTPLTCRVRHINDTFGNNDIRESVVYLLLILSDSLLVSCSRILL
jgi:hypothetical protein